MQPERSLELAFFQSAGQALKHRRLGFRVLGFRGLRFRV